MIGKTQTFLEFITVLALKSAFMFMNNEPLISGMNMTTP